MCVRACVRSCVRVCQGLGGCQSTAVLGIIDLAGSESANVRLIVFVCVRACVCVCMSRLGGRRSTAVVLSLTDLVGSDAISEVLSLSDTLMQR